jgi:DeoR/GlpR family transcriptional regulator of sugar metabolism
MDYSKFGNDSLALIAPTKEVDNIITDWNMPSEAIQQFNEQSVNVIVGNQVV